MSTRILANDDSEKGETGAVMFDGTTGRPFGQVFDNYEQADAFVRWVLSEQGRDPGRLSAAELDVRYRKFLDLWRTCGLTEDEAKRLGELQGRGLSRDLKIMERTDLKIMERKVETSRVEVFGVEE